MSGGACSQACGFCGRCSAEWERNGPPDPHFQCVFCGRWTDDDRQWPYCSIDCVADIERDNALDDVTKVGVR